jgi:hypothetical protein
MIHLRKAAAMLAMVAIAPALAGCEPEVPDDPSWASDVRPILLANCALCHGYPALRGAPSYFRLDVYDDFLPDDADPDDPVPLFGAAAMGPLILAAVQRDSMPPRFPLGDRQKQVLANWMASADAQMVPPRGPPAPDNRPPTIELRRALADSRVGDSVVILYEIRDPDFDLVTGALRLDDPVDGDAVTRELLSGRGEAVWDLSAQAPGTYQLIAVLDDGSATVEVDLGMYEVTAAGTGEERP